MAGAAKRHGHARRFPADRLHASFDALSTPGRSRSMDIKNEMSHSAAGGLRTPTGSDKKEIDQRSGHSVRGSRSRLCNAHLNCCCNSGHSHGNVVVVDQVPSDSDWLLFLNGAAGPVVSAALFLTILIRKLLTMMLTTMFC